jgi:hypothetical protein
MLLYPVDNSRWRFMDRGGARRKRENINRCKSRARGKLQRIMFWS